MQSASDDAPSAGTPGGLLPEDSLLQRLLNPVDIASLVFFRIFFGVIAFWHVWLQMPDVKTKYIDPDFHFTYPGFGWVEPLPGELMHVVVLVMAAATIFIALGLYYRYAAAVFFLTHTYILLIDASVAWNHYYLISLLGFLLIFVPANKAFSLDVARGAVAQSDDVPAWTLWSLRGQMAIVYFFAGLAKLSSHDWLNGEPMSTYLSHKTDFPLIGRWLAEDWAGYLGSYSGMLFDLLIVPALLWRRTRYLGLALAVTFHLSNSLIFSIQVFPWLALAATLLFLPPAWPRLGAQWRRLTEPAAAHFESVRLNGRHAAIAGLLALYFVFQVLLPLRHFLYSGNAEWTYAGHYHAWRMLLAEREREIAFYITSDDDASICEVDPTAYLYPFQTVQIDIPDMIVQFAHMVGENYEARGATDFKIRVWTDFSINGREGRGLIDPDVDLLSVSRPLLGKPSWIIDLEDAVPLGEKPVAERCPDPVPLERLRQIGSALEPE